MNSKKSLFFLCMLLGTLRVLASPAPSGLLSIDRMGAGAPAGWGVRGERHEWEPTTEAGPLGMGAARINLGEKGQLTLCSPVCALPADASCKVSWWMRSEPAGADVTVTLRDNYTDSVVAFDKQAYSAEGEWKEYALSGTLRRMARERYFLQVDVRGNQCALFIDGLHFESPPTEGKTPRKAAGVTLRPEAAWGLVTGGAPLRFTVTVAGATQPGCLLRLRAAHVNGQSADFPPVTMDTAGLWKRTLTVPEDIARPFGMLRVEATVTGTDGTVLSDPGETLLARAPVPVPGPLPGSPFGIHVSLREPDLSVAAKLGYKWCRIHDASAITKWGAIEPEPGKWVWHDEEIALARSHGFSIMGMLDGSPAWESGNPETSGYWSIYHAPQSLDLWRNYVRRVVGHYAGAIDQWEVWNEPWNMNSPGFFAGGSPWLYNALLEAAYTETKAANPNSTVIGVNTWPPLWDQAVLAMGAYPYYDELSFHRYDPRLQGRAGDSIAETVKRLESEQAPYGTPKPLAATEGGPDVAGYHGSFLSFADPEVSGEWSHGANQFARTYLSYIQSGVKRFIAYSIHNQPQHYGQPTCMMVEPGWLLRPAHLAVAALAHFVEGARFERRFEPAADVTALVFRQTQSRDFAPEGCTVAVLFSDGEEAEDLPVAFPEGVRCFDRWGNPAALPAQATEDPVYLVAAGETQAVFVDALQCAAPGGEDSPNTLADRTLAALTTGTPPVWTLFSAQGAVAVTGGGETGSASLRRAALKTANPGTKRLALPRETVLAGQEWNRCGPLTVGTLRFVNGDRKWSAAAAALRDGPGGTWRYLSLGLIPSPTTDSTESAEAEQALRQWETAMASGQLVPLRENLNPDAFCMMFESDILGTAFWQNRDLLVSTLTDALTWGKASVSSMTGLDIATDGSAAACTGKWDLRAPFHNMAPMVFAATLLKTNGHWLLTSFCGAPPTRE